MKQRTKNSLAFVIIVLLIVVIGFLMSKPTEVVEVPVSVPVRIPYEVHREPEFRKPPIKQYKPGHVQQMGVLLGNKTATTITHLLRVIRYTLSLFLSVTGTVWVI